MILSDAISEYLLDQQARGNSSATVEYYRTILRLFLEFVGDLDVLELRLDLCRAYAIALTESGISSVSRQTYIRGLRAFLNWLYEYDYIDEDLCAKFKLPKAQRKLPEVLSDAEISSLFSCFTGSDWRTSRNRLLVALMVDSGLRRHEAVTLQLSRIHLSDRYLIVTGKGNKDRLVPIAEYTYKCLRDYLDKSSFALPRKYLLIQESPDGEGYSPISDNTIKQLFRRLKDRTGIERLHPHLLRHTFATRYYMHGGSVYTLQAILGHESLEMTKRYVSLAHSMMVSNYSRFSPLDNLFKKTKTDHLQ